MVSTKDSVLQIQDLRVHFDALDGVAQAVRGLDLEVPAGETLGLVGESGCGKSVTALAVLRLLSGTSLLEGIVRFEDKNLLELAPRELQKIRGNLISIVFQEPMTSLNPVFTVGEQVAEVLRVHQKIRRGEAWDRSVEMLKKVQLADAEKQARKYPHQLSGGQRQRVMIAMALICSPKLLVADEPTTALDVTIQAEILQFLRQLQESSGMSILLITHDLGVVAQLAHQVAVMYAGKIVERGSVRELFNNPRHPYTKGLLDSVPRVERGKTRFTTISGRVPRSTELPNYCAFYNRCKHRIERCRLEDPPERTLSEGHQVRCFVDLTRET